VVPGDRLGELAPKPNGCVRLVCISDTHNRHSDLTEALMGAQFAHTDRERDGIAGGGGADAADGSGEVDILIHAGDFTNFGTYAEVDAFCGWLDQLPIKHKLVVCTASDVNVASSCLPFLARNIA
jgi:3',5'-cyclic AMP phosphodiesterase CpdA